MGSTSPSFAPDIFVYVYIKISFAQDILVAPPSLSQLFLMVESMKFLVESMIFSVGSAKCLVELMIFLVESVVFSVKSRRFLV